MKPTPPLRKVLASAKPRLVRAEAIRQSKAVSRKSPTVVEAVRDALKAERLMLRRLQRLEGLREAANKVYATWTTRDMRELNRAMRALRENLKRIRP